jgi:hypothetical protein
MRLSEGIGSLRFVTWGVRSPPTRRRSWIQGFTRPAPGSFSVGGRRATFGAFDDSYGPGATAYM